MKEDKWIEGGIATITAPELYCVVVAINNHCPSETLDHPADFGSNKSFTGFHNIMPDTCAQGTTNLHYGAMNAEEFMPCKLDNDTFSFHLPMAILHSTNCTLCV